MAAAPNLSRQRQRNVVLSGKENSGVQSVQPEATLTAYPCHVLLERMLASNDGVATFPVWF